MYRQAWFPIMPYLRGYATPVYSNTRRVYFGRPRLRLLSLLLPPLLFLCFALCVLRRARCNRVPVAVLAVIHQRRLEVAKEATHGENHPPYVELRDRDSSVEDLVLLRPAARSTCIRFLAIVVVSIIWSVS